MLMKEKDSSFGQFFLKLTSACPSEFSPPGRSGTTGTNINIYLYTSI